MSDLFSLFGSTLGVVVLILIAVGVLFILRGVYMWYSGMDELIKMQQNMLRELVMLRVTLEAMERRDAPPNTPAPAPQSPPAPKAPSTVYIPLPFTKRPPQPPAG